MLLLYLSLVLANVACRSRYGLMAKESPCLELTLPCIIYVDFSFVLVLLVVARHAWKSSQSTKYAPWRWTSDSVSTHIVEVNQQHPKDWLLPRFTNISDYDDLNSRNFPFQSARREIFLSLSVSRLIIFVQI